MRLFRLDETLVSIKNYRFVYAKRWCSESRPFVVVTFFVYKTMHSVPDVVKFSEMTLAKIVSSASVPSNSPRKVITFRGRRPMASGRDIQESSKIDGFGAGAVFGVPGYSPGG